MASSREGATVHELALFAGAGGGILGGALLGWRTVCAVECDRYAADVLLARQNDGTLAPFPIWDDVRTFDGRPWRGRIDVVSGGFPCQDISLAGKGAGIEGARSGLWGDMARVIGEVRPRFAFVENSPALTTRGLGRVLGDLAELGFDAEWTVLGADNVGALHRRKRIWILAHADRGRLEGERGSRLLDRQREALGNDADGCGGSVPDPFRKRLERAEHERARQRIESVPVNSGPHERRPWPVEPDVGRVAHGVAARVDRLRAIGNGQVPRVAAAAFELLRKRGGW